MRTETYVLSLRLQIFLKIAQERTADSDKSEYQFTASVEVESIFRDLRGEPQVEAMFGSIGRL